MPDTATPAPHILEITPERAAALKAASDILGVEANELAYFSVSDFKGTLLRAGAKPELVHVPPRVQAAISTEMARLRSISQALLDMLPPKIEDEEE